MADQKNLFTDFPSISPTDWKNKVIKDLKGRSFEELQWALGEGLTIDPFYTQSDVQGIEVSLPQTSTEDNNWEIAEDFIIGNNLKKDNEQLLESLMGGIDAPRIFLDSNLSAEELAVLFKDVEFDYISTHLRLSDNVDGDLFFKNFNAFLFSKENKKNIAELKGSILGKGFNKRISARTIGVDSTDFYSEDIPKELAKTIQLGVNQIMSSVEKGHLERAFHSIVFNIKIGKSYFPSIAKLRALQVLWARICKGFDVEYIRPEIEVEFATTAYTEEKNSNMIRATTMAMAAITGGADRLIVLPSDHLEGDASPFSRRIARNVQHLLKMESFFDKVVDPASGSYYIEKMTQLFVDAAWEEFLKMEG